VFVLASQDRHAAGFRKKLGVINTFWAPKQIVALEHAPPNHALHLTGATIPISHSS
jgi:hypothetical protein